MVTAATYNAHAVAAVLLEAGASVDLIPTLWWNFTAFSLESIRRGNLYRYGETLAKERMIAGTPFATAALNGSVETMQVLLDAGADPCRLIHAPIQVFSDVQELTVRGREVLSNGGIEIPEHPDRAMEMALDAAIEEGKSNKLWCFNAVSAAAVAYRIASLEFLLEPVAEKTEVGGLDANTRLRGADPTKQALLTLNPIHMTVVSRVSWASESTYTKI